MLPRFKTRQEAEQYYHKVGEVTFLQEVSALAVAGNTVKERLFHLSFSDNLPKGLLKPKPAQAFEDHTPHQSFTELAPIRFSCSPTVEGCYYALFMIIDELLHHKYKEVDTIVMSLYEVILAKDTQVLTNQDIIDYKLIHDARLTKEYGILNEFKLRNLGEVWFKALWDMSDKDGVWYIPYDEPKVYDRKFASLPMVITETTVRNVPELKLFMA